MDSLLETLLDELRPQLPEWYPDVASDAELVVANDDARAIARVVRITVPRASGAPVELIAKTDAPREPAAPADRPRLVPMTDPELRRGLEFEALKLVEARLREVGDDRLEAVRALGVLPESNALVMEVFE